MNKYLKFSLTLSSTVHVHPLLPYLLRQAQCSGVSPPESTASILALCATSIRVICGHPPRAASCNGDVPLDSFSGRVIVIHKS